MYSIWFYQNLLNCLFSDKMLLNFQGETFDPDNGQGFPPGLNLSSNDNIEQGKIFVSVEKL